MRIAEHPNRCAGSILRHAVLEDHTRDESRPGFVRLGLRRRGPRARGPRRRLKPAKGSPLISLDGVRPWLVGAVLLWRASARLGPLYGSVRLVQREQNSRFDPYSGPKTAFFLNIGTAALLEADMRSLARVATLFAFVLLVPALARGQGSITGLVRDSSGAVLPGVSVEAASPALIEKVRTAVSDGAGQYRIVDLRPGTYSVVFTLPGFATVRREGIELTGDFTASVNASRLRGPFSRTRRSSSSTSRPVRWTSGRRRQAWKPWSG